MIYLRLEKLFIMILSFTSFFYHDSRYYSNNNNKINKKDKDFYIVFIDSLRLNDIVY